MDTTEMDIHDLTADDRNQLIIHPSGKKIKSANFPVRGKGYTFVLGINYDVTLWERVHSLMGQFLTYEGELFDTLSQSSGRSLNDVYSEVAAMFPGTNGRVSRERRQLMLEELHKRNFFELQKSVPFLAEKLNVSKYTLYKDMKDMGIQKSQ